MNKNGECRGKRENLPYCNYHRKKNSEIYGSSNNNQNAKPVTGLLFSYDQDKVEKAIEEARALEGIYYVRVWLNEGELQVGDDIMFLLSS